MKKASNRNWRDLDLSPHWRSLYLSNLCYHQSRWTVCSTKGGKPWADLMERRSTTPMERLENMLPGLAISLLGAPMIASIAIAKRVSWQRSGATKPSSKTEMEICLWHSWHQNNEIGLHTSQRQTCVWSGWNGCRSLYWWWLESGNSSNPPGRCRKLKRPLPGDSKTV